MRALPLLSEEDLEFLGVKNAGQRRVILEFAKDLKQGQLPPLCGTSGQGAPCATQQAAGTAGSQACRELSGACNRSAETFPAHQQRSQQGLEQGRDPHASMGGSLGHSIGLDKPAPSSMAAGGLQHCKPGRLNSADAAAASTAGVRRRPPRRKDTKPRAAARQPAKRDHSAELVRAADGDVREGSDSVCCLIVPDSDADSDCLADAHAGRPCPPGHCRHAISSCCHTGCKARRGKLGFLSPRPQPPLRRTRPSSSYCGAASCTLSTFRSIRCFCSAGEANVAGSFSKCTARYSAAARRHGPSCRAAWGIPAFTSPLQAGHGAPVQPRRLVKERPLQPPDGAAAAGRHVSKGLLPRDMVV
jgi:hypothetical protein